MSGLTPFFITGYAGGLQTNKKPFLLPDKAWAILENAYCFRERELKREGRKLLGRLTRILTALAEPNTDGTGSYSVADLLSTFRGTQPQAEIIPGSITFKIDPGGPNETIYTDPLANGVIELVSGPFTISEGHVNYITGAFNLTFTAAPGAGVTTNVNLTYAPTLPVMGIINRELSSINDEETIFFDEIYAYNWNGTDFQEFIPGTTWNGGDSDFFWGFNYRSATSANRILFVTNFKNDAGSPIRYTDGATWTTFNPLITANEKLYQARIIVAYWGRLLFLNTFEGTSGGGYPGAVNFFNRCRFSQLGDPTALDAYRTDIFGKGAAIDAPTTEAITDAWFVKNTLIVRFERTTWQLRYVGEYGMPFIWERISADFGSESTFSGVLFDNQLISVGDKGITASNSIEVQRIDLDIPTQIFQFKNGNNGVKRVYGIRDYNRELIFWNYPDAQTEAAPGVELTFPNKVLLYNYRNNTWAIFRDSITAFGTFQSDTNITWASLSTFWDSSTTFWADSDTQSQFPLIVCGDQQGYISCYGYDTPSNHSIVAADDQETLTIQAIDLTKTPIEITSVNHNLQPFEIIYITDLLFLKTTDFSVLTTNLNNKTYQVAIISKDKFSISKWDSPSQQYENNFSFTPTPATALYVGGGQITLFPKLNMVTKDINLFQAMGMQVKLSKIDFLFEGVDDGSVQINLWLNASVDGSTPGVVSGNKLIGKKLSLNPTLGYYTPGSDYSWYSYYATLAAQYFNINITYDDDQMNTFATHSQTCTLYAINAWCRKGGKIVF